MRTRTRWKAGLARAIASLALVTGAPAAGNAFPAPEMKVLLLGTFHFRDPGLDSYQPEHEVDILSERRQAELDELLACLEAYAPTRIAVERKPDRQEVLETEYARFREGKVKPGAGEIHQVAFRLAARLKHERLYAVDAEARYFDPWIDPEAYARDHGQAHLLEPGYDSHFDDLYAHDDELKLRQTLREHFLYMNHPDRLLRGHGHYLVGGFAAGGGGQYAGADSTTGWYNRNLRITSNIVRISREPGERILVLIGAGHVPVIRHAFRAHPAYELVEAAEVLRVGCGTPG